MPPHPNDVIKMVLTHNRIMKNTLFHILSHKRSPRHLAKFNIEKLRYC